MMAAGEEQRIGWTEDDRQEMIRQATEILRRMKGGQLVNRWINLIKSGQRRVTEPWMAMADRSMTQFCLLADGVIPPNDPAPATDWHVEYYNTKDSCHTSIRTGDDEGGTLSIQSMGLFLEDAVVYLWQDQLWALSNSLPLPPITVTQQLLPFEVMYWVFEEPLVVKTSEPERDADADDALCAPWMLIFSTEDGLKVGYAVGRRKHPRHAANKQAMFLLDVPWGTNWPSEIADPGAVDMVGNVLRGLAFMNSPYTQVERNGHVPRAIRREAAAKGREILPEETRDVYTILLRRSARESQRRYEAADRAYRHSWWVSGHIRNQWYPSERCNKPIYIAPYLKGQGPLITPVRVVAR